MGKRNKGYYIKSAKGGKKGKYEQLLQGGMKGFLITCGNKAERDATREAYSLFNDYADKMYGPEKSTEDCNSEEDEEEDIEKALKKEVENMKKKKSTVRRFQSVDAGANNVVFIKTTLDNPVELLTPVITDLDTTRVAKSRHIMKVFPVIGSCKCEEEKIKKTAIDCLETLFKDVGPFSYYFLIKIRNHTGMNKGKVLPVMCEVFKEMDLESSVKYHDPDYVISVDIIKSVCCFSVLKDFSKYKKYNLQEIVAIEEKPTEKVQKPQQVKTEGENDENTVNTDIDLVAESGSSQQVKESDEIGKENDGNSPVVDTFNGNEEGKDLELNENSKAAKGYDCKENKFDNDDEVTDMMEMDSVKSETLKETDQKEKQENDGVEECA